MKGIFGIVAVSLATSSVATAETDTHNVTDTIAEASWYQMVSLEPCMNGLVSASGLYPSQFAENMSYTSLGVMASLPPDSSDLVQPPLSMPD